MSNANAETDTLTGSRVRIAGQLDNAGLVLRVKRDEALVRWDDPEPYGQQAWMPIKWLVLED